MRGWVPISVLWDSIRFFHDAERSMPAVHPPARFSGSVRKALHLSEWRRSAEGRARGRRMCDIFASIDPSATHEPAFVSLHKFHSESIGDEVAPRLGQTAAEAKLVRSLKHDRHRLLVASGREIGFDTDSGHLGRIEWRRHPSEPMPVNMIPSESETRTATFPQTAMSAIVPKRRVPRINGIPNKDSAGLNLP